MYILKYIHNRHNVYQGHIIEVKFPHQMRIRELQLHIDFINELIIVSLEIFRLIYNELHKPIFRM